jgi:cytidine deaminase
VTRLDDKAIAALVQVAREVRERAYAPYSNFLVGAAVLCEDGTRFIGCNVENASYPQGICAERAAISAAVAGGYRAFVAIAVVGSGKTPVPPCGGCRQVLSEFGDLWVISAGVDSETMRIFSLRELLPESFGEGYLS